jgi:hypothetical protein
MASTKISNGVTLPITEAQNLNAGPEAADRVVGEIALSNGPDVDPESGTYRPAAYLIAPGVVRIDR